MNTLPINRVSHKLVIILSLVALFTVLSAFIQPPHPPEPDEGAGAHIFQLSVVAVVPMILVFLATADWRRPLRCAVRPLVIPVAALALAFGALYYLEHYRWR